MREVCRAAFAIADSVEAGDIACNFLERWPQFEAAIAEEYGAQHGDVWNCYRWRGLAKDPR